jgi:hypothetical protein
MAAEARNVLPSSADPTSKLAARLAIPASHSRETFPVRPNRERLHIFVGVRLFSKPRHTIQEAFSGSIPTFASHLPQLRLQMLESQEPLETFKSSGA